MHLIFWVREGVWIDGGVVIQGHWGKADWIRRGTWRRKVGRGWGEQNQAGPLRPSLSSLEEWRKGVGTPSAGGCLQMVLKLERRWL